MGRDAVGIVLALLLLAPAGDAAACSCARTSLATQVEQADFVFTGRILGVDTLEQNLAATIAVDEVFKGGVPAQFEVLTYRSSASCGYSGFEVGEEFLVFALEANGQFDHPFTHLCTRTSRLTHAAADLTLLRSDSTSLNYMPIDAGNVWEYAYPPYETTPPLVVSVSEVVQEEDRTWFGLSGLLVPADTLFADSLGNVWMRSGTTEQVVIDFTVADGESYSFVIGETLFEAIIERGITAETNVGRFDDCVRFDITSDASELSWSFTFAPGVGLVLATGSNGAWYGLSEATVSGKLITSTEPPRPPSPGLAATIHPNPLRDSATLSLELDAATPVRVTVHDALGREVTALTDRVLGPGVARLEWDSSGLASGLYFVYVVAGGQAFVLSAVRL